MRIKKRWLYSLQSAVISPGLNHLRLTDNRPGSLLLLDSDGGDAGGGCDGGDGSGETDPQ